jgi:hypothetical protein
MNILSQYGHKFNSEFGRWEVYRRNSTPIRGEVQPVYVAKTERMCLEYIARCKKMELIYGTVS